MLNWLNATAPNRRRNAAYWQNQQVGLSAEVLEIRAVPSSMAAGFYTEPFNGPDDDPATLIVNQDPDKGPQIAIYHDEECGTVRMKVVAKAHDSFLLKPTKTGKGGWKGSVEVTDNHDGTLSYHTKLHNNELRSTDLAVGNMFHAGTGN
jgi:hypothetical protein